MVQDTWGLMDYLGVFAMFIPIWLFHAVPLLAVSGPVWFFGRNRVKWIPWDFVIVIVPFTIWAICMVANGNGKSLSNLVEGIWIGCIAPLAPIARVIIRDKMKEKTLAIGLLASLCIIAVADSGDR